MAGIVVVPGWILEAMGYWFPPGMVHLWTDNVWEELGRALGNWVYAENVLCEDHHHSHPVNRTPFDNERNFNGVYFPPRDEERFKAWRNGNEFPECLNRITEAWKANTGEKWAA